ncbi:hypothetical protein KFZ58_18030 [Virgibacillus sp. NKC19-16]|uniref:hypothetical protein n=1 Tax=Virgibacillus salidurans TaxID=2831673 RepID=UPI001F3FF2FA|nr:hypothetical protein [Virgibacillus sp. NKC19-16]UJL46229.1 hypothetical protein KFZ58_18030 [Virgibacillus sp. NKC19-16]
MKIRKLQGAKEENQVAEIILVCERHIPRSMWNYVDRTQPFVSVLKQDSRDYNRHVLI